MTPTQDTFPLAESITMKLEGVAWAIENDEPNHLIDAVTSTTADLLRFWFQRDFVDTRTANFHIGQRDAILAIIYAHEALGATSLLDLYEKVARESLLGGGRLGEISSPRNQHPKYAAKMATGTGKTWVLNALLTWLHLNATASPGDPRFTSNFLIVAPGLIVYDRLLDSFQGKRGGDDVRDFETSDIFAQRSLFIPDNYRPAALGFVQSSVVTKQEIGRKITGAGVIALTNWHLLAGQEDAEFLDVEDLVSPGADVDAREAARSFVPLTPGTATGNSLEVLDRRFRRGEAMQWLKDRPSLAVFNDEAHHVHSLKRGEEESEVEWQRSLNELATGKGRQFVQVDFSATPYNEARKKKQYFPHIVVDFDLMAAMDSGLVKAIALDKRQEIAALANADLDFSAERDENRKVIGLSEGQRTMLRAGLSKLAILEEQFVDQDPEKHPKMLVMLEDTTVAPFVEDFLRESGMKDDDFLRVDSGKKRELGPNDWQPVRDKLFDIDARPTPRVVISVLMLREGFDVNNICVIVPLRSSQSGILLEQTIGRGLRLMWRGEEAVEAQKAENRARIKQRKQPANYYDVLFVVEHPRFAQFYEQELGQGLVIEVPDDRAPATGDSERTELRAGHEEYDFAIPFIVREAEEELTEPTIAIGQLTTCTIPLDDLKRFAGSGDTFVSEDLQTNLRFGQFRVDGVNMNAVGYNDFLGKLTTRVANAVDRSFTKAGSLKQHAADEAILQVQRVTVMRAADSYIRRKFFGRPFDPFVDENWRVLLFDVVSDQLAGALASALVAALQTEIVGSPQVFYRSISEVEWLTVRSTSAVEVAKCVYPKLPISARSGGLERLFLEWADSDPHVQAIVKIHEYKHDFLRRPYLKADGMPAQYSPDFLVRTARDVYVVETKAQSALSDANVQRKQEAARGWCEQLNQLPPELRSDREWHYALLGERRVKEWRYKGASASELLDFARVRPAVVEVQPALFA